MAKKIVCIYRSSFPLYSEVFISEQIKSYSDFVPIVVCRNYYGGFKFADVINISSKFKKLLFTIFPSKKLLDDPEILKKINLIHAHFGPDATFAMNMAKESNVPLFVTCHGSDVMVNDWSLLKSGKIYNLRYLIFRKKLFEFVSFFIAVSDFLRHSMIEKGFPAEKIITNYIGVDVDRFTPSTPSVLDEAPDGYIISVARHVDVKGIDVLLMAFSLVIKKFPKIKLIQIGDGLLTSELKSLSNKLNIDNNVLFLGAKSSDEVLFYIKSFK